MRLYEMQQKSIVTEYGSHGFSGYGRSNFRKAYYEQIVNKIRNEDDENVRVFLADWFADLFARDHPGFKPDRFKAAVENGGVPNSNPVYQQRHFYYFAHHIQQIDDPHIREFLTNWLADVAGKTNPNFQMKRWVQFCTPAAE